MTKVLPIKTKICWNFISHSKKAEVLKTNLAKLEEKFPELKNIPSCPEGKDLLIFTEEQISAKESGLGEKVNKLVPMNYSEAQMSQALRLLTM